MHVFIRFIIPIDSKETNYPISVIHVLSYSTRSIHTIFNHYYSKTQMCANCAIGMINIKELMLALA